MLKFCSLRRGQSKPKSTSAAAPPLPAKRVSKSSSLRLQDVALSDAQLLSVLKAQRARGPLILALSSAQTTATKIVEEETEVASCQHCGTPYSTRKTQAEQNGSTTTTTTTTATATVAAAGKPS
ncbi:hypothetical protein AWZ03_003332 [Drosophila navojoa]|uniref:Uncharacterized protein n=1 Tax=Drosophila navojoa TaxID=7232 RepID=A0A484BMM2_DRONA|nr:hypothetical protein AWZ03_003332 [Drosophila navojoa]